MSGLERSSHRRCVRAACHGRLRYGAGDFLPRHMHEEAFATIVLKGGYVEAGDTGRHCARPGDVVLHRPYEHHLDRVEASGSEILVIPLSGGSFDLVAGHIDDPDELATLAELDVQAAEAALFAAIKFKTEIALDWPDDLACALRQDPSLSLRAWAHEHHLSFGSVSRGFNQVYGVPPRGYRLLQRTHRAISEIMGTNETLVTIAHNCGFADQAHMNRAVQRVTALAPRQLRSSNAGAKL